MEPNTRCACDALAATIVSGFQGLRWAAVHASLQMHCTQGHTLLLQVFELVSEVFRISAANVVSVGQLLCTIWLK